MKKIILFFVFNIFTTFGFSQNVFDNSVSKSGLQCLYLNGDYMEVLDSFGINYCSPFIRMIMIDSVPNLSDSEFYKKMFHKFITDDNQKSFELMPNPNRVIQEGLEFLSEVEFFDSHSKNLNFQIYQTFRFDVIGKKEYELNENSKIVYITDPITNPNKLGFYKIDPKNFKSVLIVEKYFEDANQVTSSVFLRLKNGKLIDPGMNFYNLIKLSL